MTGTRSVICSTVFTPATPVASAYMYNMGSGIASGLPERVAAGQYRCTTPVNLDLQKISITARGYNAAGDNRLVTVVPSAMANDAGTQFDIFIKTDAGAASDDCLNVECTVSRLPL
jgi:hypothetical protein